jgi:methylated-DNA-[protein]-cysteine S-methyltransferase
MEEFGPSTSKRGTEMNFTQKIWQLLSFIPKGKVISYGELARAAQSPAASRAVGQACNKNPHAPRVPCHRVVSSNGGVGGYANGIPAKIKLLEGEGITINNNKILNFSNHLITAKQLWQFQNRNISG